MKICLIHNLYFPFAKGGAEQIVKLMKQGFVENGHQVDIITSKPYFQKQPKIDNIIFLNSCYFNLNKMPKALRLFWHGLDLISIIKPLRIKKIIQKNNYDLIITHNLQGLGRLTPLFLNRKQIHVLHDIQLLHPSGLIYFQEEKIIHTQLAKLYQKITRASMQQTNLIISPSHWLLQIHQKNNFFQNKPTMVLPNPVKTKKDKQGNNKQKENIFSSKQNHVFSFLFVGQIEKHKGIDLLLSAFTNLEVENNNNNAKKNDGKKLTIEKTKDEKEEKTKLLVVGQGQALKKLQKQYSSNKNIKFLGYLDNTQVQDIMQKSDCLVAPSICYENYPTIFNEAFQNNLMIIASNLGGVSEALQNNSLFLFSPQIKELTKKLVFVQNNYLDLKEEFFALQEKQNFLQPTLYTQKILEKIEKIK